VDECYKEEIDMRATQSKKPGTKGNIPACIASDVAVYGIGYKIGPYVAILKYFRVTTGQPSAGKAKPTVVSDDADIMLMIGR
jgi:hypothetical protein